MVAADQARRTPAGRRPSLVERAYSELKRRILANEMPPGAHALEQELARDLQMSRTPVHEALIRIERESLIEILPRRGIRVKALSPTDMRELYDVIGCIESKAVELLACRKPSAAELQPLEDHVGQMERALEADDLDAWARADRAFHESLLTLSGNRRLAELGLAHLEQTHRVRLITLRVRRKPFRSTADHRELVALIRDGDADRARDANWRHRVEAAEELVRILEETRLGLV